MVCYMNIKQLKIDLDIDAHTKCLSVNILNTAFKNCFLLLLHRKEKSLCYSLGRSSCSDFAQLELVGNDQIDHARCLIIYYENKRDYYNYIR